MQTASSSVSEPIAIGRDIFEKTYRWMLLARVLDNKFASLYRAGKIYGGVFVGRGQEAVSAATGVYLQKGDVFGPLIRDLAGRLAFGETVLDAVRTYLGSPLGPMRGRDGNVHRGRPRDGILPMISHLGSMISVTTGVLFARKMRGEHGSVGASSIGDGGTSTGSFHEGINLAAVEHLPLIMVVTNNQYAYSTPTDRQFVCHDLVDKALGYGIPGYTVDGTDLAACLRVMKEAIDKARNGGGPQLIRANTLRLSGHAEHDDGSYMQDALKQSPVGRDCIDVAKARLLEEGWKTEAELNVMQEAAMQEVDEVVAMVQREKAPDPYTHDWCALATRHLAGGQFTEE